MHEQPGYGYIPTLNYSNPHVMENCAGQITISNLGRKLIYKEITPNRKPGVEFRRQPRVNLLSYSLAGTRCMALLSFVSQQRGREG